MYAKRSVALFSALIVLSCSGQNQTEQPARQVGVFEEAPCPVQFPEADAQAAAVRCGYVRVPEFHDRLDGRTLRLAVAVFPKFGNSASLEPLVISPPGPGTSAIGNIGPQVASGLGQPLRELTDVVLIENRGLPLSEPALLCPEIVDAAFSRLQEDISGRETLDLQTESVRACRERLRAEGIELNAFNFAEIAADLAMVMTALKYEKFSIYGTSAGTIVAQHVMRLYPDRIKSVIIDSTAPLGRETLQAENPSNGSRGLHVLFESCANDPACSRAYPGLEANFDSVISKLNEKPVTVSAQDPRTGGNLDVVINGDRLAEMLFMATAQTPMIPAIPGLIYRLEQEDYEVLKAIAWAAMPPPGDFSHGLGHSAMCSEFNTLAEEDIVFEGRFPAFESALADMSWGPKALIKNCGVWDIDPIASKTRIPVESDVPTLILAGQLDTLTPSAWADTAAQTLTNSYVYEIPGFGHSPTFYGPCPASLALQFLKDSTRAPDASCVSEMEVSFSLPSTGSE
jgi:pimeloyl-ACP methyl ester carboxylesterase